MQRRGVARADDVGRHDDPVAIASAAADLESLAAEIRQPRRVDEDDIVFEQLDELLLLLFAGVAPITAEHESGDAGAVEIGVEQFAKTRLPDRGIALVVEHLDGAVPELVHEGDGIRRIYHRRGRRSMASANRMKRAGQKGTAHHVDRNLPQVTA